MYKPYPVSVPLITDEDKKAVLSAIENGWVSSDGPYVPAFEEEFSKFLGMKFGASVSSGTGALEAAMYAIGIKKDDEVIMPSFTIISCALAVTKFGAIPVLVDIEKDTWNIDVRQVLSCISKKTKAIIAVHMYGHSCEIMELRKIANEHGIYLIEDASQVHGGMYNDKMLGSIGDLSTFSFYANKLVTTGEGGMVVGNSKILIDRAKSYRNLCFDIERRYIHYAQGSNLRMTSMQAALGSSQLKRLDLIIKKKRLIGSWYRNYLGIDPRLRGQVEMPGVKSVYWMYCFVLTDMVPFNALELRTKLTEYKVGNRAFFTGLHKQPCLEGFIRVRTQQKNTENATERGFYLPSSLDLEENDVHEISKRVIKCLDILQEKFYGT